MCNLAYSFISSRQLSVQEAVRHCLTELWFRKCNPECLFVNTNLPEERYRILKSAEELDELPDDSTDIFQNGIIECYNNRPSKVDQLCFPQFGSYYSKKHLMKMTCIKHD